MFTKAIAPKTKRSLALLSKITLIQKFSLAGGTAAALRLGHRLSFDLDFFTTQDFSQKNLINLMQKIGKFTLDQISKNTLLGIYEGTKVSFFKYDYPLIGEVNYFNQIAIISNKDLMAMKIDAISTRGKKRDFIDLYFLCQKSNLKNALTYYKEKYRNQAINIYHSIKALNYFIDADEDETKLVMLKAYNWEQIKQYFLEETPKLLNQELKKIKL